MKTKIASVFFIFLSFFYASAINDGLDSYAPEKHFSFEQQGKRVDNFLTRTYERLKTSFRNISRYYELSKSDSVRRVQEAAGKLKNSASEAVSNTVRNGMTEAHKRFRKK